MMQLAKGVPTIFDTFQPPVSFSASIYCIEISHKVCVEQLCELSGVLKYSKVQMDANHISGDCKYKCRVCGKERQQHASNGYSNLRDHLTRSHNDEFMREYKRMSVRPQTTNDFVTETVDAFSLNVYRWLDRVVEDNFPLSMCERPRTRKCSSLDDISTPALKRYMEAIELDVQASIKA